MEETAAGADHDGGLSTVGRGATRRCRALYANAEVEVDLLARCMAWDCMVYADILDPERIGRAVRARRAAMVDRVATGEAETTRHLGLNSLLSRKGSIEQIE